jgi:hypothetical protein
MRYQEFQKKGEQKAPSKQQQQISISAFSSIAKQQHGT